MPTSTERKRSDGTGAARVATSSASKATQAWEALNERQQTYLKVIYAADQEAEKSVRIDSAAGKFTPPASTWRWLPFSPGDDVRGAYTAIQYALERAGVWDSGAGATLQALGSRGLILVRHEPGALGAIGVDVRLTTAGRAAARSGLGVTRARKPKGLLSRGLWNQFVKAATAELAGEPVAHLWRETHLYLGAGYTFRGHPSRGYLEEINPTGAPYGTRWYLTDAGRAHLAEHLETYRQLYPDVDTTGLAPEPPTPPAASGPSDPPAAAPASGARLTLVPPTEQAETDTDETDIAETDNAGELVDPGRADVAHAARTALAALERHLDRCALADRTVTAYRRQGAAYVAWLDEHADDHPDAFADVVGAEGAVTAWKRHLLGRKLAASSVNQALAAVTLLYELAGLRISVKRTRVPRPGEPDALTAKEQAAVERAAERHGVRDAAIIAVLLYAGPRVEECERLDLDDIAITARTGRVRLLGKGDQPRTVPLPAKAREKVNAWLAIRGREPGPLWISQRGGRLTASGITQIVLAVGEAAGLVGLRPHRCRHTYATALRRAGADPAQIQYLLGHASAEATARYFRAGSAETAALVERVFDEDPAPARS